MLRHDDAAFDSQVWTAWATELLAAGETHVLIGTRGLLGEGWDCPPVNVLVDMTAVAADVSVRQMRGRSLRLDPADPSKLANNWDVVCVAPELGRGHADYGRFVRRHAHLHAPCEDGTIETGPSHVHPELSPYGPPAAERFVAINIEQQERAADRDAARARWSIGAPYRGVDLDVLVVRNPRRATADPPPTLATTRPPRWRWLAPRRGYPEHLPLEWAAAAVCDAYVALGELPAEVAHAMQFTVRPEGWVRVSLPDADVEASATSVPRSTSCSAAAACRATSSRARWRRAPSHWCGAGRHGTPSPPTSRAARSAPQRSTSPGSAGSARQNSSTATAPTPAPATWPCKRRACRPSRPSAAGSGGSGAVYSRIDRVERTTHLAEPAGTVSPRS